MLNCWCLLNCSFQWQFLINYKNLVQKLYTCCCNRQCIFIVFCIQFWSNQSSYVSKLSGLLQFCLYACSLDESCYYCVIKRTYLKGKAVRRGNRWLEKRKITCLCICQRMSKNKKGNHHYVKWNDSVMNVSVHSRNVHFAGLVTVI